MIDPLGRSSNGGVWSTQTLLDQAKQNNKTASAALDRLQRMRALLAKAQKGDATGLNPDNASVLERGLQQGMQAVAALQTAKVNYSAQRKAAARQKIEALKRQLDALRMVAGGNSKEAAAQIARLARELSAAAHEYAAAGGGGGDASVTASSGGVDASAGANATSNDGAAASDGAANGAQTSASGQNSGQDSPSADGQNPAGSEKNAGAVSGAASGAAVNVWAQQQAQMSTANTANSGSSQQDHQFAADVRLLAARIRGLLSAVLQQARTERANTSDLSKQTDDAAFDAASAETAVGMIDMMV